MGSPSVSRSSAAAQRRQRFIDEALRKREGITTRGAGRGQTPFIPRTILNSQIDPQAVGTTLIVGRG